MNDKEKLAKVEALIQYEIQWATTYDGDVERGRTKMAQDIAKAIGYTVKPTEDSEWLQ